MAHQVLYRKHRPKNFDEVVGQDHVIRPVTNAIRMGKIAHAYLFSGPRGVGKTTIARLIAKAVNCANTPGISDSNNAGMLNVLPKSRLQWNGGSLLIPCNECEPCIRFNEGRSFDLIEIDAASNTGVDDIRELREAVKFVPAGGAKKVYIIDEVHMLSKGAFNALLKTLEEPPEHAIFVLATTELEKVPATIVSRTQHFDFRRPTLPEIARRLTVVAGREGVNLSPEACYTVAFVADGSMRDAESILGKILAVEGKNITEEEVNEILGVPRRMLLREMLLSVAGRDAKKALGLVGEISHGGYDHAYAVRMLIQYFRNMLLLRVDPTLADIIKQEMPEEDMAFVQEQGKHFPDSRLRFALSTLVDALMNLRKSPIPQLPLELAMLEIIQQDDNAKS